MLGLDPEMLVTELERRYKLGCYVADTNDGIEEHGPFRRWVTHMLATGAASVTK